MGAGTLSPERIRELMEGEMERWEHLEQWIHKQVKVDDKKIATFQFTARDLAADCGIEMWEATGQIQSYLRAQRRENPTTLYALRREGRTRGAVWGVARRVAQARVINETLLDDVVTKVNRGWQPDMKRLALLDPDNAIYVERKIESVMTGALVVLRNILDDGLGDK